MKSFLILLSEKQPDLLHDALLNEHISFLKKQHLKGHLVTCGPFTDNNGAVLIIKADTKNQAEETIKRDPFVREHYYKKFSIHEFMMATDENNWLADAKQTQDNLKNK